MAKKTPATIEIVSRELVLLDALASSAEDLANRSKSEGVTPEARVALRNQAKLANEQAAALLARGTMNLFNDPPSDAAKQINDAIAATQGTLARITEIKKAIKFVTSLVGVATAALAGDWAGVVKSLVSLTKKTE
jgi:hypothetical protein